MFPEPVERSFLDPEYSFVTVGGILRTTFAKQTPPKKNKNKKIIIIKIKIIIIIIIIIIIK